MTKVIDIKPYGGVAFNVKPGVVSVNDIKPTISKIFGESIRWSHTGRGMPIGLLLALTYPEDRIL